MKFFETTVSGWESLAVVTKKSILVPTGVQDSPLLEIEISKLNKHHTSGREFYIFCGNLVPYKKRKYLDQLKWNNTFQKQPPRRVFQICIWQISLKKFKNIFEGAGFSKELHVTEITVARVFQGYLPFRK